MHAETGGTRISLDEVLGDAQDLGFFSPQPIARQRELAEGLVPRVRALVGEGPRTLDLGAGGGLPGLVLARSLPAMTLTMLDANGRRCAFLREAVQRLELANANVLEGRAEGLVTEARREAFDLVVARGFGPPAATAECASPYLKVGGYLLVTEPPEAGETARRWSSEGLADLGLGPAELLAGSPAAVAMRKDSPTPGRFPRRDGVAAKRPLF